MTYENGMSMHSCDFGLSYSLGLHQNALLERSFPRIYSIKDLSITIIVISNFLIIILKYVLVIQRQRHLRLLFDRTHP